MKKSILTIGLTLSAGLYCVAPAQAGMDLRAAFQDAALSIDAWGSNSSQSGFLQTDVPVDATVVAAYLYSADVWGGGTAGNVILDGNPLATNDGILLPKPASNYVNVRLYDVTSYLKAKIEASPVSLQNWSISENGFTDGEVLVVAYKNASTAGGTAILLDGGLAQGGDTTKLTFAAPYTSGDAIMSVASSFSYGDGQYTTIDVKTSSSATQRRLTSAAGGNDDGSFENANGALITAGGVGDSTANPADPTVHGAAYDDELYNLAFGNGADATPFIKAGDTWIELLTNNPSFDDNLFITAFTSSFKITDVDDDDIDDGHNPVPEPGTMLLFGSGLLGLAATGRRRKIN